MNDTITMPPIPPDFPFPVSQEDIPYATAVAAYSWNSMMPERRARQEQADYLGELFSIWTTYAPSATSPERRALLIDHVTRYRERLRRHSLAILAARSRVANPMVTGPANFPVARNRKRLATEDRRVAEYIEWRKRARAAIARDMRAEDADWQELRRSILRSLGAIAAIDEQDDPFTRSAFTSSIAGRVERIAATGDVETVRSALQLVRDYNAAHKKPAFTDRHAIWKAEGRALNAAAKASAAVAVACELEIPGVVTIVDNPREERVQLLFPGKPDDAMRTRLKSSGFRWSPSGGVWQAYRTQNTVYRIRQLFGVEFKLA